MTMNKVHSKLLRKNVVLTTVKMSTKSSSQSHYDTLEINPRATHGEIKTAYFKLSKQYHPDKNSSSEATQKFRDVVEAYEVLGNHDSRKVYDRSIITRTAYTNRSVPSDHVDTKAKYYQAQSAVFKDTRKSGSIPPFNFDEWTRAHYGRTFQRTMRDRTEGAAKRMARPTQLSHQKMRTDISVISAAMIVLVLFMILTSQHRSYDNTVLSMREKEMIEKKSLSETQSHASGSLSKSLSSD